MTRHDGTGLTASLDRPRSNARAISVVLPVHGNAECLEELHARLKRVIESRDLSAEIVFVDDACPAGSGETLRAIAERDEHVAVIRFMSNVGQHRAVLAGLRQSHGERVVVMDADLQDSPEAIPLLLDELDTGYAAVFAGRRGRYESRGRLLTSRLFKTLLHAMTGVPRDAGMFVAMNRTVVERLLAMHAPSPFVVAMIGCVGLPVHSVPIERNVRPRGSSSYTGWRRLRIALSALAWTLYWRRHRGELSTPSGIASEGSHEGRDT